MEESKREGGIAKGVLKLDTRVVAHLSKCTEEIQTFKRGLYCYSLVRLFGSKEGTRQNKEQTSQNKARGIQGHLFPYPATSVLQDLPGKSYEKN